MENIIKLINLADDIYNSLGPGYNEVVYHRAFEVALRLNGIPYESEVVTPIFYKGANIGHGRVDLKLNGVIIELKAINNLNNDCIIQTKNYMRHYSIETGVVINFGQSVKGAGKNLGIILLQGETIYDYTNETFIPRNNEINC